MRRRLRALSNLLGRVITLTGSPINLQAVLFWLAAFTVGLVSVGYAWVFKATEQGYFKFLAAYPWWGLILTPACFVLSYLLVAKGEPLAGGSGIPQVMAAAEMDYRKKGPWIDRLVSIRAAAVKILSSLACVAGGGAIGREGPTLQISTSIFHSFGGFARRFNPGGNVRTWIVTGAAAGLASAFNTPLGGIVYAIEELGLVHFHLQKTTLLSAVIIAGIVAQWLLGNYLYLGFPQLNPIGFSFIPLGLAAGLASGLLGALFGKILTYAVTEVSRQQKNNRRMWFVVGCGFVLAGIALLEPRAVGSGKELMMDLLFGGKPGDLSLVGLRLVSTLVSYLSGAAAGIFAPSLALGASLGSWLAAVFHSDHANMLVLLCMTGFLTGVTRTPFTSFVLVLEMTDRHNAIFPLALSALAADAIARLVDARSFYGVMMKRYLKESPKEVKPLSQPKVKA